MRNLKRALSMLLSSTMVLGMVVMGGSAAGYQDVDDSNNKEAIEVLQAAGIMTGVDDAGNFDPEVTVTRNQMAVIMSNLMAYNVATYAGTSPFTDVPEWAEPYVAACWTNGITAGIGDTLYGGDQEVTTSQAALMIMKALGYFQYQSDFGSDWQLATVTQGNRIDLFNDVNSGVKEAMTRNDVAQLVLNGLESGTVQAESNGSITVGDITIVNGAKYNYITSGQSYAYAINPALDTNNDATTSSGSIVELGEKLYQGDLMKKGGQDDFGRPASIWTYKNKEVGTYADEADYTYTKAVSQKDLYNELGATAVGYAWDVYYNGADLGSVKPAKNVTDDYSNTATGTLTEVFVNNVDRTVTVTMTDTFLAEVVRVQENDSDVTVTLNYLSAPTNNNTRTNTVTLESTDLVADDKVLVTTYEDGNQFSVDSIVKAATVTGEVTAVKSRYDQNGEENGKYAVMDDTQYDYVDNTFAKDLADTALDDPTINAENTLYLDVYGNMIAFEATKRNVDYVYLDDAINALGGINALATFADGVTTTIYVDEVDGQEKPTVADMKPQTDGNQAYADGIYAYEKQGDSYQLITLDDANPGLNTNVWNRPNYDTGRNVGEFDDAVSSDTTDFYYAIKNGTNAIQCTQKNALGDVVNTQNVVSLTASTIFVDVDGGVTYTGYTNVPTMNDISFFVVYNRQDNADVVFITDGADNSTSDSFFYVTDAKPVTTQEDGTYYYEYSVMMNNEKTTITFKGTNKDAANAAIAKDTLYKIETITPDGFVKSASVVGAFGLNFSSTKNVATYADNGTLRIAGDSNIPSCGNSNLDNSNNERIYAYNKDTQFVYIETKLDGADTVSKTVGVGSANMINTTKDKLTGNNNVYVVAVDDKDARTPIATLVYIVEPVENVDNGFTPDVEVPAPAKELIQLATVTDVHNQFLAGNNVIITDNWTTNADLTIPKGFVLKVNGDLDLVTNNSTLKNSGKLIVTGELKVSANQYMDTLTGTIVAGSMTLNDNTTISADVTLTSGNLTAINRNVVVSTGKNVLVDGNINLGAATLTNNGHVEWTGNLTAANAEDFSEHSMVGGTMTVTTLTVGNSESAGNVSVTGLKADVITLTKGDAAVVGTVAPKTNGSTITVTGSADSALSINGNVTSDISVDDVALSAGDINGSLTVTGDASAVINSATSVSGDAAGNVTVSNSETAITLPATTFEESATLTGAVTVPTGSEIKAGATVTSDDALTMSGDGNVTLKGTLVINGEVTGLDKLSAVENAVVTFGADAVVNDQSVSNFKTAAGIVLTKDQLAGKTFTYNGSSFVCEANMVAELLEQARAYDYPNNTDPDFRYNSDVVVSGNTVTIALDYTQLTSSTPFGIASETWTPRAVLYRDFSRLVGALHYVDDGASVSKVTYDGTDYTWSGSLEGSNWKHDDTTLISAIFGAGQTAKLPGVVELTVAGETITIYINNNTGVGDLVEVNTSGVVENTAGA